MHTLTSVHASGVLPLPCYACSWTPDTPTNDHTHHWLPDTASCHHFPHVLRVLVPIRVNTGVGKLNFRSDACWGGAWGEWCAFPRLLLVGARHINISSIDQRPFSDIAMTFCHGFLLARVDIITNSVPGGLFFFRRFFFGFRRSVVHNEQSPLRESLCGSSTVTFVC